MNNFLEELKTTKVINKDDIDRIKKFINIKYKDEDSKKRAYMLSNTVHNIIEDKIKFFPKSIQKDLKNTIFKNTFLNNKDSIYLWDIFYSYIDYVDFKEENLEILLNWVNVNIKNKTNREDLLNYLCKNNLIENIQFKNSYTEIKSEPSKSYPIKTKDNSIDNLDDKTKNNSVDNLHDKAKNNSVDNLHDKTKNNSVDNLHDKIKNNDVGNFENKIEEFKEDGFNKKINSKLFYKQNIFIHNIYNKSIYFILIILGFCSIFIYFLNINNSPKANSKNIIMYENKNFKSKKTNTLEKNPNVPEYIKYKSINTKKLKKYLYTKNSLLVEEPYFSSIIKSAEEFDINPLLLFAIAGQEQGFVPKKHKYAKKIANNPFNVFHSWQEYNTNIEDSSRIAGRTVFNLLKDMPKGKDPFKWINTTYAEDKNWWKGVKSIFYELEKALK